MLHGAKSQLLKATPSHGLVREIQIPLEMDLKRSRLNFKMSKRSSQLSLKIMYTTVIIIFDLENLIFSQIMIQARFLVDWTNNARRHFLTLVSFRWHSYAEVAMLSSGEIDFHQSTFIINYVKPDYSRLQTFYKNFKMKSQSVHQPQVQLNGLCLILSLT